MHRALSGLFPDLPETAVISVMELLAYVVLTVGEGGAWRGLLILYVGDNTNVIDWLQHRQSPIRVVQWRLALLSL